MSDKSNQSVKSHADLIASYYTNHYKTWLSMAADEAQGHAETHPDEKSDFYSREDRTGVKEDSAEDGKFL